MWDYILCDMDGVVADFWGHALRAHDSDLSYDTYPKGEWNMPKVLGLTDAVFWAPIDNYDFWVNVPMYPGARGFVDGLRNLVDKVVFVSRPSLSGACAAAKIDWLHKNMGIDDAHDYVFTAEKGLLAGKDRLLIDDNDKNVEYFVDYGGAAMLFPRVWNSAGVNGTFQGALDAVEDMVNLPLYRLGN